MMMMEPAHGANLSASISDQITTAANLTTPDGKYTIALFYWPDHVAGASDNNDVIQFADLTATGRIWLQWDHTSNAAIRQAWAHNTAGGQQTAKYPTAIPARAWSHLMARCGRELDAGNSFNTLEACLAGVAVVDGGAGLPTAHAAASITIGKDIYGQNAIIGDRYAMVAVWKKMCLTEGESWYAAMGGDPGSIRPSKKAACLIFYLPGTRPIIDASPAANVLTLTGMVSAARGTGLYLLPPVRPLGRSGNIYMVMHRGGTGVGERETTMYMAECTDGGGFNFEARPCYQVPPAGHVFTDADVFFDPVTSKWYAGCINTTDGTSATWDLYSSTDGNEWLFIQSVDCSAIATGATPQTYKPRFFLDDDNSLHVDLGLGTSSSNLNLYEQHPTNRNDLSQAWSTPVIIAGSGLPTHAYDSQTVKEAGTYYKFFSNADNLGYMNVMSSASLTTGYTMLKTGDWAGLGQNAEGICLIHRADGKWVLYPDQSIQQHRVAYSVSNIAGTLANVLANATWSAPAPINFHGLPDVEGNFVAQGPTVRIVP